MSLISANIPVPHPRLYTLPAMHGIAASVWAVDIVRGMLLLVGVAKTGLQSTQQGVLIGAFAEIVPGKGEYHPVYGVNIAAVDRPSLAKVTEVGLGLTPDGVKELQDTITPHMNTAGLVQRLTELGILPVGSEVKFLAPVLPTGVS